MTPLQSFATVVDLSTRNKEKLYVSEVRMLRSKDWLIGNGYTFIDYELNTETIEDDVYPVYNDYK